MKSFLVAALFASPAYAGIDEVIDDHILSGYAAFEETTRQLSDVADDCDPASLKPAYHAAFDAWIDISHLQFGPIEEKGLTLAIAFWPDPKNNTGKSLGRLLRAQDEAVETPAAFAEVSVAAQGLFALEYMLYDEPADGPYACALTLAITRQLAAHAHDLNDLWITDHAAILRSPGPQNPIYNSEQEAQRVIYTSLTTGLEFVHGQRLDRPLGTFERPRPKRAEARRSKRSQRNIARSLAAMDQLSTLMTDGSAPETEAAFDVAIVRAEQLNDPTLEGVSDPSARFRIEVLQQKVAFVQQVIVQEIGEKLGIRAGFNSLDGD